MTDDSQQNQAIRLGTRLRQTREALNLTEKEVAARLRLKSDIIRNLENEDFQNTSPTFTRGYLRAYARLLNFSEADITAALMQTGLTVVPSTVSLKPALAINMAPNQDRYLHFITSFILVALFILVGIWWTSSTPTSHTHTPAQLVQKAPAITQPAPVLADNSMPALTQTTPQQALAPTAKATINPAPDITLPPQVNAPKKLPLKNPPAAADLMVLPEPELETS